jgi:uncharacterized protein with HEPN domain
MSKAGRSVQTYLQQLLEWTDKLIQIEGLIRSKNDNVSEIEELALARAFEVVGEICGQMIANHPQWTADRRKHGLDDAYRLRNRISHGYDSIDTSLLLAIARDELLLLKAKVETWLAELET